jgi:hypothetical protein
MLKTYFRHVSEQAYNLQGAQNASFKNQWSVTAIIYMALQSAVAPSLMSIKYDSYNLDRFLKLSR